MRLVCTIGSRNLGVCTILKSLSFLIASSGLRCKWPHPSFSKQVVMFPTARHWNQSRIFRDPTFLSTIMKGYKSRNRCLLRPRWSGLPQKVHTKHHSHWRAIVVMISIMFHQDGMAKLNTMQTMKTINMNNMMRMMPGFFFMRHQTPFNCFLMHFSMKAWS